MKLPFIDFAGDVFPVDEELSAPKQGSFWIREKVTITQFLQNGFYFKQIWSGSIFQEHNTLYQLQ